MDYFEEFKHLFQKTWCPVFGLSPGQGLPEYNPLAEAGKIISEARQILKIGDTPSKIIKSNYPHIDTVVELLKKHNLNCTIEDVVMHRDIFREARCITQYAVEDERGRSVEGGPIHLFIEKTLTTARNICSRDPMCLMEKAHPKDYQHIYYINQVPDYDILATLAIKAAHREADLFVIDDIPMNLSKAYSLLGTARKLYADEKTDELEKAKNQIEELKISSSVRKENCMSFCQSLSVFSFPFPIFW